MHLFACMHAPGNLPLLIECARYFSPHLEECPPDTLLFDLTGLEKLFGDPHSIAAQIETRAGLPARIAVASDPDTAFYAARGIAGVTVIPAGEEARVLGPLPVNLLEATPDIAETLDQWGIRRFGELAALPPLGVAARLGNEGIRLWQLARGEGRRLLNPERDPLRFAEELELEYPVDLLEPLAFVLSRMLHDICGKLHQASLAAAEIRFRLALENGAVHARALRFPVPMEDPLALLKLLQLELQGQPPSGPVVKVYLEAEPARPQNIQHGLFRPVAPEPEKLEITIARISAFVGAGNIGSPRMEDSHRPDAFHMAPFGSVENSCPAAPEEPRTALRRFRPPRVADVQLAGGRPSRVRCLSIHGVVNDCSGPWRTSGAWWSEEAWDQDEWDVALSTGALLRLRFDRRISRWFLEGSYD